MMNHSKTIDQLESLPTSAGIYAWYYIPTITKEDVRVLVEEKLPELKTRELCSKEIDEFFLKKIFNNFKEEPYKVDIYGSLKPKYSGMIEHKYSISKNLIERIIAKPERLYSIADELKKSIPIFSSPIYIGMAKNLRKRLLQHKFAMEKYVNEKTDYYDLVSDLKSNSSENAEDVEAIHSFAYEVSSIRKFHLHHLTLFFKEVEYSYSEDEKIYNDLENILNRINYPLCGRN